MALTIAHHSGRDRFQWEDLVESITTLESGTAVGIEYVPQESSAVAIHEAGHAIAGHAYMTDAESTRLSIRMRGGSLGHHQAREKEERFSRFQSEVFARLVWGLGAMAAERVFYGENSSGVGGDVQSATSQAAAMVGAAAMGPQPFHVEPNDGETEEQARPRARALREDRPPDHEPHGRRAARCRRTRSRGARRPGEAARRPRRSSARPTSPRTTSSSTTARPSSGSPTPCSSARSCSATSCSSCCARRTSPMPEVDLNDEVLAGPFFSVLRRRSAGAAAGMERWP